MVTKKVKSKIVFENLNPVWNHTVTLPKGTPSIPFRVEVWDHDQLGSDDFLGHVELNGMDLTKHSCLEHPLQPRSKKDKGIRGSIEIKVEL